MSANDNGITATEHETTDIKHVSEAVRKLRTSTAINVNDVTWVRNVAFYIGAIDSKLEKHIRDSSENDARQDACIIEVNAKLDRIEQKTDIQTEALGKLLTGAASLFNNPKVKALLAILWTALLSYLASKGWNVKVEP